MVASRGPGGFKRRQLLLLRPLFGQTEGARQAEGSETDGRKQKRVEVTYDGWRRFITAVVCDDDRNVFFFPLCLIVNDKPGLGF